jgi:Tol biopolymer transport system component
MLARIVLLFGGPMRDIREQRLNNCEIQKRNEATKFHRISTLPEHISFPKCLYWLKMRWRKRKMKMTQKVLKIFGCLVLGVSILYGFSEFQQTAGALFEKALFLEEARGELQEAIDLYLQIVDRFSDDRETAAKAQLHIGLCYEKLGKSEAIKAYELVLEKFSEQKEQAATALSRLAELKNKIKLKTEFPGELTVTKTRFFMNEPFELSPDGTKMVGVHISPEGGQNVVVSNLETGQRDYITHFQWMDENNEYVDEYYWTYNPVWSPDGREIAYLASFSNKTGKKGDNQLCVSDLRGQSRILIRSETDWFVPYAWMPDGTSILAIKGDKENKQELGLVSSTGGKFLKLVSLQGNVEPYGRGDRAFANVSPDGRFIVYTDIPPGEESELFITTSDGKAPWPLAPSPAVDSLPRWSPDGKHIIFLSNRHGSMALWGVAIEEGKPGDPFLIQDGMGNNLFGNWTDHGLVSWNWIRMRDIFVLDVNPSTGEPVGKPKQLDYLPSGFNTGPVFAPEGDRLAFLRNDTVSEKGYLIVTQGEKGDTQEFKFPEGFRPMMIRWKPTGSGIGIYGSINGENVFLNLSFDSEIWDTIPIPNIQGYRALNYAGNAKDIFFGKNGIIENGAGIYERNLETGEERLLYRPKDEGEFNFMILECSKDYKKLAFLESRKKLIVIDLETAESHEVIPISFASASWSPDGQRLMTSGFLSEYDEGQSLMVISVIDGTVEEYDLSEDLPSTCTISLPDWSADGKQVAFVLMQNKSEHLIYTNIIPEHRR